MIVATHPIQNDSYPAAQASEPYVFEDEKHKHITKIHEAFNRGYPSKLAENQIQLTSNQTSLPQKTQNLFNN